MGQGPGGSASMARPGDDLAAARVDKALAVTGFEAP